jgi:hypothetical protein
MHGGFILSTEATTVKASVQLIFLSPAIFVLLFAVK